MSAVAAMDLSEWDRDPRLFLFTSLTAGSSHIFSATSRMETILKANKIPFQAIDVATDDKARKLWGRRAGKRKLPGLVKEGFVIADMEQVEEWNEFGELKEAIGPVPGATPAPAPAAAKAPSAAAAAAQPAAATPNTTATPADDPMRDLAAQAASIGLARQKGPPVLVDASKIRPLEGQGTAEAAQAKTDTKDAKDDSAITTAAAATEPTKPEPTSPQDQKKTSIDSAAPVAHSPRDPTDPVPSVTADPPKPETMTSPQDQKKASIDIAAAVAYYARDPTDPVPSAGTPIAATHAHAFSGSTPVAASDQSSAAESSDSLAGGRGLADASEESSSSSSPGLKKITSSSSSASQPAGSQTLRHRGSDVRVASLDEIRQVEDGQRIDEGDETETDKAAKAADPTKAGVSVQD